MRFTSLFFILASLFAANPARAWVDVKNANFAMTRTDFEVEQAGPDLLLERTYNSRVEDSGLFGRGWCSNVESKLTLIAKGLVAYQYCGAGRAKIFKSPTYTSTDDEAALDSLVKLVGEKMNREAKIPNGFKAMLKNDVEIRAMFVRNYGFSVPAKDGERFVISNFPEASSVTVVEKTLVMREEDGDVHKFQLDGSLLQISDRNGQSVEIEYVKGVPKTFLDSRKNRIVFMTDQVGRIVEARGPNREFKYRYSTDGDLVAVEGFRKEEYKYDEGHNLTSFKWDKVSTTVKYDSKTDRVIQVKTPECSKRYKYDVKPSTRSMSVELDSNCKNKPREVVKYEFTYKEAKSGQLYQSEMTATDTVKRDRTAVRYSDENRPIWMERSGVVTEFAYDEKGRLSKVTSAAGRAEYLYDEKGRLATFKSNITKGRSPKKREIKYSYAADGALESTKDGGVVTKFSYDPQGRMRSVANNRGKKIEIVHRSPASEVPAAMKSAKDGKIDIVYGAKGNVAPPRSDEELKRFVTIMATYQELVEPGTEVFKKDSEP